MRRTKAIPKTIDGYLSGLSADKRAALQKLRKAIHAAAPKITECISYGIPAFRYEGIMMVGFGATAKHCSFYPGAHPIAAHRSELKKFETSKGTIRFPSDKPLSTALVRKLVKSRIAEQHG